MSSVPTSADPIPEADARNAGGVSPAETKSRDAEGDGEADAVKETTVTQVASLPTPTTEAVSSPAKDVTVSHEGVVNGTSATVVSDPLPPPASAYDGCTSVDMASSKQSSGIEGEGFASDVTWEERTWKMLVRLKEDVVLARIGKIRALQG